MDRHASSKSRLNDFRRHPTREDARVAGDGENGQTPRPQPEQRRKYLKDYARWLWPYRWALVVVFALAVITTALDMVWPLLIKLVIDLLTAEMDAGQKIQRLNLLGMSIAGILVVKQAIDTWRGYRTAALNAKVIFRLRGRLFEKILSLPLGQLGEMKAGGIVARLSGDVDSVSGLIQQALISPGVALIRVVLAVGILFWLSWQLAAASAVMLPPLAIISFVWLHRVRPIYRSIREDRTAIDGRVTETFGGIRVVRAFRREPHEQRDYAVGHHTVIRKSLWAEWLELILSTVWGLLIPGTVLLVVWLGGWLAIHDKASTGVIVAFQVYAFMLIQPVWQIIASVSTTQRSLAAMERIFGILEMPPDKPDAPDAIPAPTSVDEFRFDHVSFEYRPDVPVIRDFDLTVRGGQTVALVGPSGAGKTTITDLVARFYDPTSGAILLNGIDLRKLRLKSYRSLLAVVQQDVFLFDGTVRENIAYGRRGATEEQLIDAAKRANAHEFIQRLPEGYNTLIGERGFKLSGGQRQRLSIARAILADPQILILDEATSNLDTESEQLIQASLGDLLRGRTTFVIAHRLSTITHANVIVTLNEGRIVETGTHEQLMDNRGLYAAMVERQQTSLIQMTHGICNDEIP
jgi:ATP-binding cassette subfamily B protein/subfamily B ATP-binding cassette protein MsbA